MDNEKISYFDSAVKTAQKRSGNSVIYSRYEYLREVGVPPSVNDSNLKEEVLKIFEKLVTLSIETILRLVIG